MAAEEVLNLFDSYWFEHAIFSSISSSQSQEIIKANLSLQIPEEIQEPEFSRLPIMHVRSLSEQLLDTKTSFLSDYLSPKSVLINTSKLQTILSGKEVAEFSEENTVKKEEVEEISMKKTTCGRRITRKKKGSSKSLSDLEFDELKGFMDLGFVFTEEDNKDSELVSIIPGLQRLGKKEEENNKEKGKKEKNINDADCSHVVLRPYLSEAWDVLDYQRKKEKPLMMMNWRKTALGNEIDMKDHLRLWAHSVASSVR